MKKGSSGEFGHTTVHKELDKDLQLHPNCGNPKCLEAYVNAKLEQAPNSEIPPEVQEVLEDKLRDLIFSFTPNVILVDLEALPSLTNPVTKNLRDFVDNLTGKWEHDEIKI